MEKRGFYVQQSCDFEKVFKDKIKLPLFSQSFSSDRILVSPAGGGPIGTGQVAASP